MLGDQPTRVASFGNSDVNSVGDWVEILNTRPSDEVEWTTLFTVTGVVVIDSVWDDLFPLLTFHLQPVQGDSECRNMRLGLHIEVLFANFGFLAKPQPRVRNVLYIFADHLFRACEYNQRETLYLQDTVIYFSLCIIGYRLFKTVCSTMLHPKYPFVVMIRPPKGSFVFWAKTDSCDIKDVLFSKASQNWYNVMSHQTFNICLRYLGILAPFWYDKDK